METMQVIRCEACGANNRVSLEKVRHGEKAVCGRCGADLQAGAAGHRGEVMEVTDATFAARVERSTQPMLVDLWAPWCAPCRMLAPVVEKLAAEFAGRIGFAKVNTDENPATAARFRVEGIPLLLVIQGGREVDRMVGLMPAPEIRRRLEAVLAAR